MKYFIFIFSLCFFSITTHSQIFNKKSKKSDVKKEDVKKLKPYKEVIPKNTKSSTGLFTVHQVGTKWYFEIADSIVGREIMSVTRFSKTVAACGKYGGEEINSQVVRWEKGPNNLLFLKSITHITFASDSTTPLAKAVKNSDTHPIIGSFEILSIRKDTSVVIDVTEFFTSENTTFGLGGALKDQFKLTQFQRDKSYISSIRSFPINTELKNLKTYEAVSYSNQGNASYVPAAQNAGFLTFELNTSFVLLPSKPMRKRIFDPRVGYFGNQMTEYSEQNQQTSNQTYVTRWRLEPKNSNDAKRQAKEELRFNLVTL